jgi:hypothetical protein
MVLSNILLFFPHQFVHSVPSVLSKRPHPFCQEPKQSFGTGQAFRLSPVRNLKNILRVLCWYFDEEATPVLIPNTEVKLLSADGSP